MKLETALRLGRISNLPTVWTNVMTGLVLGGGTIASPFFTVLLAALSCFYVGGMYLNDAFDRHYDRLVYPERPIPSGAVSARTVWIMGFLWLAAGEVLLLLAGLMHEGNRAWPLGMVGLGLAAAIVAYDAYHKGNVFAPLMMAICRAMIYVLGALSVTSLFPLPVWWGIGLLMSYIIGLSYIARQETRDDLTKFWPVLFLAAPLVYGLVQKPAPVYLIVYAVFALWVCDAVWRMLGAERPNVRAGVSALIAGVALLDAMLIANKGEYALALLAIGAGMLTRWGHRIIPGT